MEASGFIDVEAGKEGGGDLPSGLCIPVRVVYIDFFIVSAFFSVNSCTKSLA